MIKTWQFRSCPGGIDTEADDHPVVYFAHVTNSTARSEGEFEKGEADGAKATLAVVAAAARSWQNDAEVSD